MTTLGSLFAGVGGFDLGFEAAGYRTLWQAEIDTWCQKVLAHRWPAAALHGDVRTLHGDQLAPVDVITFGSPCQDMSVAGTRAGLDGAKSVLFYEACRIIGEMREATNGRCPAWAVWENVPGALSSDSGNDFASVLNALAAVGAVEIEWRVLDARFFGVPQRRRRVFVLAGFHPRADGAGPVLLESEGRGWRSTPSGTAREDLAGSIGASAARSSSPGGGGLRNDLDSFCDDDTSPTLPANQTMAVAYPLAVSENQRAECRLTEYTYDLTTGGGKPGQGYPAVLTEAQPMAFSTKDHGGDAGDLAPTLRAMDYDESHLNGGGQVGVATPDLAVRRLTPRECERLMGWPDDHTRWTADGREIADSHRYRMCGNGVVAPVAEWIARRICACPCGCHATVQPGLVPCPQCAMNPDHSSR